MQITLTAIATVKKTPQSRQVGDNNSITTRFEAQVTEFWRGQNDEWQSRSTDLVVQAWNGLATRIMNKAPQVETKVFIEGSVDVRPYTDRENNFRAPIVVRAATVRALGKAEDSDYMKVAGIGNLGDNPEMRYTNQRGDAATNFRLAVNRTYTDSDGERQDEARWFGVTCYGRQAENCNLYLKQGSMVQITGSRIEVDTWTDKEGNEQARLDITARRVDFLARTRTSEDLGGTPDETNDASSSATADDDDMPW